MGPIAKLFSKIPNRRARHIAVFLAGFAVSLVVGRMIETVFDHPTLKRAYDAQATWIAKVESMTPLALASDYFATDMAAVVQGEWLYKAPEKPDPEAIRARNEKSARELACRMALTEQNLAGSACLEQALRDHVSTLDCISDPIKPGCAAYEACEVAARATRASAPPACLGVDVAAFGSLTHAFDLATTPSPPPKATLRPFSFLVPFAALVHAGSRILAGGLLGTVLALVQLGAGLFLGLALFSEKGKVGFGNVLANLVGGPLVVILLGSGIAFILKYLMLGAFYGLHWATGFAEAAAGAAGLAGVCWFCTAKLAEKGVEHIVVH